MNLIYTRGTGISNLKTQNFSVFFKKPAPDDPGSRHQRSRNFRNEVRNLENGG